MKNTSLLIISSLFATTSASDCANPVFTSCTYYTDNKCKTEDTETTETAKLVQTANKNQYFEKWLNKCVEDGKDGFSKVTCPSGKVVRTWYSDSDCKTLNGGQASVFEFDTCITDGASSFKCKDATGLGGSLIALGIAISASLW